jgi:hypothetical protein
MRARAALLLAALMAPPVAWAHQPIMDMAPRWSGGSGFQIRQEYRATDEVLDGRDETSNVFNRTQRVRQTWFEGVYTFRKETRVTFKLPWIDHETDSLRGGVPVRESGRGFGDLILAVPLKRYKNEPGKTRNFGITPSLRLPTGATGDTFPVADGSWDPGLSVSYSTENRNFYSLWDVWYRSNGAGRRGINRGDELGLDINLGLHPYHDVETRSGIFTMLDISARYEGRGHDTTGVSGGERISVGPVLVWYRGNLMLRGEVHFPIHERRKGIQFSRGTQVNVGAGFAF